MNNPNHVSYGVCDIRVALSQKKTGVDVFKVNHAILNDCFEEQDWPKTGKKARRMEFDLEGIGPKVVIDKIGNNMIFRLTPMIYAYDISPLTYMQYFAESAGFLIDNHVIVPPDAKPEDTGEALLFKNSKGEPYKDSRDWAIMEFVGSGSFCATLLGIVPLPDDLKPVKQDWTMLSLGWDFSAKPYKGKQAILARVRHPGQLCVDIMESKNAFSFFTELQALGMRKKKDYLRRRLTEFAIKIFGSERDAYRLFSKVREGKKQMDYDRVKQQNINPKDLLAFGFGRHFSQKNYANFYPETIKAFTW